MKRLIAIFFILTLVACGEDSKIKEAIRDKLKDPGSANFKDVLVSKDGRRACAVWNAKNSMGGYSGWEVAQLLYQSSGWTVTKMKWEEDRCSEHGFQILDAEFVADQEARRKVIEMLSKARKISVSEAESLTRNSCLMMLIDYSVNAQMQARDKLNGEEISARSLEKQKAMEDILRHGDCDSRRR